MMLDPLSVLVSGSERARLLIVAAHPDDEVIGASTRLRLFRNLTIVHVTDGAPRNLYDAQRHGFGTCAEYAAARRAEFRAALRVAGVEARCIELGIPDQEAALQVSQVAALLAATCRALHPDIVLTHPYEGGHPDHDASALAVHLASAGTPILEFASYHNNGGSIRTGHFLPGGTRTLTIELDAEQQSQKRAMLECFRTQQDMLARFDVAAERFRIAPAYDFVRPPHSGSLYYEQFDWGMTGERFRSIAREVLQTC
jgi:LmbE family N-acetylglucosaminyl deacetylase